MSQPPGSLKLETTWPQDGLAVVVVGGDLDMLTAPRLRGVLDELLARSPKAIVVDLTSVEFLGSAGLAALMRAHEQAGDVRLRIVAPAREVHRAFTVTGLDEVLALYPTREAALTAV
ncbi:STAS domain-containing protein [Amycolatopsis acidicola]|uniref:Anti-sigma factor antagonist n=1 Tax=Amycolatopsis acidicola TaxID=2596893 RepID=A0A5N0V1H7_9PSEU|nr:STAS domain-containing protein [Amycolatopsis acidicola]KAA9159769.1 STAS domain-containing protein [Amycolatopsis acidicola]